MSVVFSADYLESIERFRAYVAAWKDTFRHESDLESENRAILVRDAVEDKIEALAEGFRRLPEGMPKVLALAEVAAFACDYDRSGGIEQVSSKDLFRRHAGGLIGAIASLAPKTRQPSTMAILRDAAARGAT